MFAAVLAARCGALVLPRHTLSPKLKARPAVVDAQTRRPFLAQVDEELQETVEKSGVEGGLFSIFTGDGDAKGEGDDGWRFDLLMQYGGRALAHVHVFAIVSFAICYTLVSNGVTDVAGLGQDRHRALAKMRRPAGRSRRLPTAAQDPNGARRPIRFPPTVALTPVARLRGEARRNGWASLEKARRAAIAEAEDEAATRPRFPPRSCLRAGHESWQNGRPALDIGILTPERVFFCWSVGSPK